LVFFPHSLTKNYVGNSHDNYATNRNLRANNRKCQSSGYLKLYCKNSG